MSSIKELARRWYPRAYFASPIKRGGHRALADITESVQELRYYRETVFVPQPGPDSMTARAGSRPGTPSPVRRIASARRTAPAPDARVARDLLYFFPGCAMSLGAARVLLSLR